MTFPLCTERACYTLASKSCCAKVMHSLVAFIMVAYKPEKDKPTDLFDTIPPFIGV